MGPSDVTKTPGGHWVVRYGSRRGIWRLRLSLIGQQANHLNQTAAFRSVIRRSDGLAVYLAGSAKVTGTPHNRFHRSLDDFWSRFRSIITAKPPTGAEYGKALQNALLDAGVSASDADLIAEMARIERERIGIGSDVDVPSVPGPTVGGGNSGQTRNSCP